jgi:tetratricopeptide (TPR) repeat protein
LSITEIFVTFFISHQLSQFKYGEDIDDDNVTEQCCTHIYNDISVLHLAQRGITDVGDKEIQQVGNSLSTDLLFKFLKLANNRNSAVAVEETMKELWKAHPDPALRSRLDSGITDLLRGKREKALITFKELINDDPDYGEAWNKASTCYFMLGDMQASLEAANKALELIPHHFQVLNGLGLIQYETRRYKLAAMSFRQSLQMDPWSPVSSRLAACLDLLYGSDLKEEQGAAEGTAPYE